MSKDNGDFTHDDGISLKTYFDDKIDALEEKMEMQFRLNQVALDKAEVKNEAKLASMNEFRDALKDQAGGFQSRVETDLMMRGIQEKLDTSKNGFDDKIRSLELSRAELQGKATQTAVYISYIIAIIGIIIGIISFLK